MLTVDIRGFVTGVFEISHGTIDASFTHPREVFKRALMQNSAGIILGHNHPSGNPEPSENDINVTKKIVGGGKLLDIDVLDHIILGNDRFYSLKQHDKM
jgi:DNA repair protein RadC